MCGSQPWRNCSAAGYPCLVVNAAQSRQGACVLSSVVVQGDLGLAVIVCITVPV
jgi:hypothetical protein